MSVIEPVTLEEAKAQCRIENDSEDALISHYITAAREYCEDFLNLPLIQDNKDKTAESNTNISNEDNEGLSQDNEDNNEDVQENGIVIKAKWKQAILLIVAFWYANRENAGGSLSEIPLSAERLLWQDRRVPVGAVEDEGEIINGVA